MFKKIDKNNKIFNSEDFQKDKYKFFLVLQNLSSDTLELYSDEENYLLVRGNIKYPTWIWTKDNFDKSLFKEICECIELFRLDVDTRFTCKRELYDLLKNNYPNLGDYYFEMGYLTCEETKKPKDCDGGISLASINDKDTLKEFCYNESREITDVRDLSEEESEKEVDKRLGLGNYYVWKNKDGKVVCQAFFRELDGSAKVSGVYTDTNERGKGYAANLIYELTNVALNKGLHVSLYTDYSYIASNKAYKNAGYKDQDVLINFSVKKK